MTPKQRISFTKQRIEALPLPTGQRTYHYDDKTEGLCLCVTPAGAKTFYLYKWLEGRPVRIPLGKFPTISVENARDACRKLLGEHASGVDIQVARQAVRHEHTIKGSGSIGLNTPRPTSGPGKRTNGSTTPS